MSSSRASFAFFPASWKREVSQDDPCQNVIWGQTHCNDFRWDHLVLSSALGPDPRDLQLKVFVLRIVVDLVDAAGNKSSDRFRKGRRQTHISAAF